MDYIRSIPTASVKVLLKIYKEIGAIETVCRFIILDTNLSYFRIPLKFFLAANMLENANQVRRLVVMGSQG